MKEVQYGWSIECMKGSREAEKIGDGVLEITAIHVKTHGVYTRAIRETQLELQFTESTLTSVWGMN